MISHSTKTRLAWLALGSASIVIIIALAWIGTSSRGGDSKPSREQAKRAAVGAGPQVKVTPVPPAPPTHHPRTGFSQTQTKPMSQVNTAKIVPKPSPPKSAILDKQVEPRPLADMFPVGNILRQIPTRAPVFRAPTEVFETFVYGDKLWMATGSYALLGEVDLVPTGFSLNGRPLFALANTAGPGEVLFLQSKQDPNKFAIYR